MTDPNPVEDCYCVCHSPFSSCPSCEHCKGVNTVTNDDGIGRLYGALGIATIDDKRHRKFKTQLRRLVETAVLDGRTREIEELIDRDLMLDYGVKTEEYLSSRLLELQNKRKAMEK